MGTSFMFLDISPLKKYKDYRYIFIGQFISIIGNMMTYVAVPYQVYELTHSSSMVGNISIIQLFSVVIFAIFGGAYADRINRKKIIISGEIIMILCSLGFVVNTAFPKPSLLIIFILVGVFQAASGFHRPAMTAIIQKIIPQQDIKSVSSLNSLIWSVGAICGPAISGILISTLGLKFVYIVDLCSFIVSLSAIFLISNYPIESIVEKKHVLKDIKDGFLFAISKPEILGSYLIDIVAMMFAFPIALFPAMSQNWGGAHAAGMLYSGMAIGTLLVTLLSGWTNKVTRNGKAVVIAASLWAFFILWLGFSNHLFVAVLFLILAGGADGISGIFRQAIWNASIPNSMRGRLSGLEMISYMSGPLIGNARAGYVATLFSVHISLISGGIMCFVGVILTGVCLPKFWKS